MGLEGCRQGQNGRHDLAGDREPSVVMFERCDLGAALIVASTHQWGGIRVRTDYLLYS
jgi:hypothetical protein